MEKDVNASLDAYMNSEEVEEQPVQQPTTEAPKEEPQAVEPVPVMEQQTEPASQPAMVAPKMEEDFSANLNEKSQKEIEEEYGVKLPKEADGQVVTIKSWKFTKPRVKDAEGNFVPPNVTMGTKDNPPEKQIKYYPGKLVIEFEENNWVEYIPSVSYWVNKRDVLDEEGKPTGTKEEYINPNIKIDRNGHSQITQLFRRVICKMSGNENFKLVTKTFNQRPTVVPDPTCEAAFKDYEKTISDKQILDWLVGKKVKIEMEEGNFQGNDWHRGMLIPQ